MKLIMLNMSSQFEWDKGVFNRNKHILDELAKRDDVEQILSVDFLPFNFKTFFRLYLKSKVYKKIGKNVIAMGHHYVARRLNSKVISLSAMSIHRVKKAASKLGFGDDAIVINYNPLKTDYLRVFKNNDKYFDAVDNWANNSIFKDYKNTLEKNYKEIINHSILTFCVSDQLRENLENITYCVPYTDTAKACINVKKNIVSIPNGVDMDHYKNPVISEKIESLIKDINKKYKKIVGYLGVIKKDRIDAELLEYIIKNNKDKFFIIAGPIHGEFDRSPFKVLENVFFMGEVRYKDMPYLYEQFNVCIIPHLVNDFVKSMDPKKLYEYLASGKPVVTTKVSGIDKFRSNIFVATSKEDFSNLISIIFSDTSNFSKEKILERQKCVEEYSWNKIVDEIVSIIKR